MARRPNSSPQTEALLAAFMRDPGEWRHGYDLSRETDLKSGTLYPILIRLERQEWLEARWEDEPAPGKPRRHLYRLTAEGAREAARMLSQARASARTATFTAAPITAPEGRAE